MSLPWMVLFGCGNVQSTQKPDAMSVADAPPQDAVQDAVQDAASGPCDLAASFANPAQVAGASSVGGASLSYDELVIYFSVTRNQTVTTFRTARSTNRSAFPVGAAAPGVPDLVLGPSANEPETVLYLQNGQNELLRMTRASSTANWANLTKIGVTGVDPFIGRTALYFSANGDIMAAPLTDGTLGHAARIDSLATAMAERNPVASTDELEIAFNRGTTIAVASRTATTAEFNLGTTVDVGDLAGTHPVGLSEDRCRLYITAQVGTSNPLYILSRP